MQDAVAQGGRVVAGGNRTGTIMEATLVDHVLPGTRLYGEESFCPAKGIVRVKGAEEARVANDTEYGLSSAVFSRDVHRALQVAKRIQAGICHINGPTVADEAQMLFGVKDPATAASAARPPSRVHGSAPDHH